MPATPRSIVLALAAAGTLALAACGAAPMAPLPTSTGTSTASAGACTLPKLPAAGGTGGPLGAMTGPAVTALRGGPARSTFSLDGGALQVAPPRAGDHPKVTAEAAECAALAAINVNGSSLLDAARGSGVAIGYGRVTVAAGVTGQSPGMPDYGTINVNGMSTTAKLPPTASYNGRLAWVVVLRDTFIYPCPKMPATPRPAPSAAPQQPTGYDYAVFLLDARTGSDALLYTEGHGMACGAPGHVPPSAIVPVDQVSVPWKLVSRSSDGYSGRISATVLPCAAYPGVVLVDRYRPVVPVIALQPVNASCGAPKQVTLQLHAATVTSNLPAKIEHAPVGLYVPAPVAQPSGAPPGGVTPLRNLGPADAGKTQQAKVGDVFVVTPFPGVKMGPSPAVSSDPAILGPLDGPESGPVAEFRAWRAGKADITIPTSACSTPKTKAPPCTGPWVVHVVVS